jgi:outer membrane murein-binding lipoprotein Lpp
VETAKARFILIGCIWEAKIQRDEALRVHVRYDDLERKMGDLQDEMATACDESNAKNQAFDEWKSVASNEDWEGILAEELLIGVRIVDSNNVRFNLRIMSPH